MRRAIRKQYPVPSKQVGELVMVDIVDGDKTNYILGANSIWWRNNGEEVLRERKLIFYCTGGKLNVDVTAIDEMDNHIVLYFEITKIPERTKSKVNKIKFALRRERRRNAKD